jgi:replicative DNA helicase
METLELPHSLEAERALLGSIIADNKRLFDALEEKLIPEDFYNPQHQFIYKAILDVHRRNLPVDYIQVVDALKTSGELERVGGQSEVVMLVDEFCNPRLADSYARTVREKSTLRKMSILLRELSFEVLTS